MKKFIVTIVFISSFILNISSASAAAIIDLVEVGGNVVGTASGSLNVAGLTFKGTATTHGSVSGEGDWRGIVIVGPSASVSVYQLPNTNSQFVADGTADGNVNTGDTVGILSHTSLGVNLYVVSGYVSNSPISATTTWNNKTLADLRLISGVYTFHWGSDTNADTLTINIRGFYTVGGTVSGLTGSVTLQNNGGDDLVITADGSFAFAAGLKETSAYNVTVSAQPAGQTCTVTNGNGSIPTANITNITVACTANSVPADDFVITVKTDNPGASTDTQFTIPTTGGGYDYNVDCNDDGTDEATGQTGNYTCDYGAGNAGTYTIRIKDNTGAKTGFSQIYFNSGGDKDKLLTIEQWGTGKWRSMAFAFAGCTNLVSPATDTPDFSGVTSMRATFQAATAFNGNISSWDISKVTDMSHMFFHASSFNQDLNGWDVSKVTDMSLMFQGATAFNGNISSWDVSSVGSMPEMFSHASNFNQDLNGWDVSNVSNMRQMFQQAYAFTGLVSDWDIAKVTAIDNMFWGLNFATRNYDLILNKWNKLSLHSGLRFTGHRTTYCDAISHTNLTSSTGHGWTIGDGGQSGNCLKQITPVPPTTTDPTPDYTFSNIYSGDITYAGACSSSTTTAAADSSTTVTFNTLADGTYSNCVITLTEDETGNANVYTLTVPTFTVTVSPVATADAYSVAEDGVLTVPAAQGVLANDSDPNNRPLTAVLNANVSHGVLALSADGGFTYTPTALFNGTDTFTYHARNDNSLDSLVVTVTITVGTNGISVNNSGPVAYNSQAAAVIVAPALKVTFVPPSNLDEAKVSIASGYQNGADVLGIQGQTGTSGTVDGLNWSWDASIGVLSMTGNASELVYQGALRKVTYKNTSATPSTAQRTLTYSLGGGLRYSGTGHFYEFVQANIGGQQAVDAAKAKTYFGLQGYLITVTSSGESQFALNKLGGRDAWIGAKSVTEGGQIVWRWIEGPEGLEDGGKGRLFWSGGVGGSAPAGIYSNWIPAVTPNDGAGIFAYFIRANPCGWGGCVPAKWDDLPGTLTIGTQGGYVVEYGGTLGDPLLQLADNAFIIVEVAPVAAADAYSVAEDGVLSVPATGVLGNDHDANNDPITAILVTNVAASEGSVTLSADGSFTYTPFLNFNGSTSFTYKANDGVLDSNTTTVTITVSPANDPPVAQPDAYSTPEDVILSIPINKSVLQNDSDVDVHDHLTAIKVTDPAPAEGTVNLNADGTFTYTPTLNFNGVASFTYKANDGATDSNTVTVSIHVNSVNDAPLGGPDHYSIAEDSLLRVPVAGVLANDHDVDNNTLLVDLSTVTNAGSGTVTMLADGSFEYQANSNFNGADSFTYQATDGKLLSGPVTVSISVTAVNDPPVANPDAYSAHEDTGLSIDKAQGLLANDSDTENNSLTAQLVTTTSNGTLHLNNDGSYTYTPALNFNGTDSFTYQPYDGHLNGNTVTVSIVVDAVNDAPVANDDGYTLQEDALIDIDIANGYLVNDTDIDGDSITGIIVTQPASGTVHFNTDGSFTYRPDTNFNGNDSFTYKANDGALDSNVATVNLTVSAVNDPPVASPDSYSTQEDSSLKISAKKGILNNDTDIDGNHLISLFDSGPSNGQLHFGTDGGFTYTPDPNFNGTDQFSYHANDGVANSAVVVVTIHVNALNDAPVASDDGYSIAEDGVLSVTAGNGVLNNDVDLDGDILTVIVLSQPASGALSMQLDGSFGYKPDANFNGKDSFTYKANDGSLDSNVVTVRIVVNAVNDTPVGNNDAYSVAEDGILHVETHKGLLTNDQDPDGDQLKIKQHSSPANGTLQQKPDGSFNYIPDLNFNGSDSFTYIASDGLANSSTVTVTITVNAVNDAPLAQNDSYTAIEDTKTDASGNPTGSAGSVLTVPIGTGVLVNDSDLDGDQLSAQVLNGPANGSVHLNLDGSFKYRSNLNFNGTDTFTYHAFDGALQSMVAATVTILVTPVNDAPVANADAYSVHEDTNLNVDATHGVLDNDSDVDNNLLIAILVNHVSHGTLNLNNDGSFSYTPDLNFNGQDSFSYKPNDGNLDGNTVTVIFNVDAINDAPVANADAYAIAEDGLLTVPTATGLLSNDLDIDGDQLLVNIVSNPANGQLQMQLDGSFTYKPNTNFNGVDSFTYKANDGSVDSNTVTVTLIVHSVNDAPLASGDSYNTQEDTAIKVAASGVLANDLDADGNILTAKLVSPTSHGLLHLGKQGDFTYTPDTNYNGTDQFTYKANDGKADSNTVTVQLNISSVNDAPIANTDAYSVAEDGLLSVTLANGVLANDSDADGNQLKVLIQSSTSNGLLQMKLDGSFTYKPDALFNGSDSFTYMANDGMADSAVVTVTITVNHVNHTPLASDDAYVIAEDGLLSVTASNGLLANDLDVDGDQLLVILESSPGNGLLRMKLDGSFTYKPNGLFNGTDSFTYKINDGSETSNTATVTIKVNHTNHAPLAADDAFSIPRDTLLVVPAPGILANDLDIDGDSLFALIQSATTHGALGQNLDGSFTYSPAPDFSGTDSFTYMTSDGKAFSGIVTVTIIVSAVNHAPIAGADSYSMLRDSVLIVDAIRGLLSNDMDPDGNTLTANIVDQPMHGVLSATPQGGFTYTPAAGYSGLDSFSYKASDGSLGSNVTSVSIDVKFTNSAPVAVDDAYSVPVDTMLQISATSGLLINDTDADGGILSAIVVTQPSHGTLHLRSDGGFDYIPDAGYAGADSFIYKVTDGAVDSNQATVSLDIHSVNHAPTVSSAEFTVFSGEVLQVPKPGLLTTAKDPDGDSLKLILVDTPGHGVLTVHPDGSFSYFPDPNYTGPDRFSIRVTDGNASSPTVIISVRVLRLTALPVPTLNSWTMFLMALLLFGIAAYRLRLRREH